MNGLSWGIEKVKMVLILIVKKLTNSLLVLILDNISTIFAVVAADNLFSRLQSNAKHTNQRCDSFP